MAGLPAFFYICFLLVKKMFNNQEIKKIENIIGYTFKNKQILFKAFTHSSYANIHGINNNERLEFLGDSILGFVTTIFLFENFTEREGTLSKAKSHIVSTVNLSLAIDKMNIISFLKYGNKKIKQIPGSVKADLFEAIIGAIYMDDSLYSASEFILRKLNFSIKKFEKIMDNSTDYKSTLQEIVQSMPGRNKVSYRVINKTGPAHSPVFTTQVKVNNKVIASSSGDSKKISENEAAKNAIKFLRDNKKTKIRLL